MTKEDETYAVWLNLLGSDLYEPPEIEADLHLMHDAAEASHPAQTETA